MLDTMITVISFIIVLGILITVHEYGHFIVARKSGVKILRFSIGFGKILWSKRGSVDNTEYAIAMIPLGGYVKMLDEREGEVDEAELDRAFNRQPLSKRFAIVAAGPLFNLVFAVIVYWAMFINGVPGTRAFIDTPTSDTPTANANLIANDEIISVAGKTTPTWQAVLETVLPMALLHEDVELGINRGGEQLTVVLPLHQLVDEVTGETFTNQVGLKPLKIEIPAVIETVVEGSAAQKYGILPGDEIVAVGQESISDWLRLVEIIQESPGRPLLVSVNRRGDIRTLEVRPDSVEKDGKLLGKIGASVHIDPEQFEQYQAVWQFAPHTAFIAAVEKSWDMSILTVKMIGKMIIGEASVENLSGPISIARYAGSSLKAGLSQLLGFIAIISVSLGVLNLLPVPILDGGHLFFYLIEWIKGSPVNERIEALGQQVGLVIILSMMSIAIFNDLVKLTQ